MTEAKSKSIMGWRLVSGAGLAIILAILGCGERNVYAPPPAPQVTVSQPVRLKVTDYLEFTGNTQAINTVQLRARVEGYLEKVFFQDGDRVKKGQLLFLIQQNTYQAQLKQAEAQILQQKAQHTYAVTQVNRYTKLVQQKAAAQSDLDNWRYQRDASQAAIEAAVANRDLAKLNLEYTSVTAPFEGRIDRRLVDPGNLVGSGGATVLANVNQIDPIYVYFTINETELLRVIGESRISPQQAENIKIPLSFGLATEEGYPHQGYLDFAAISLAPTTGTLQLRGIFMNPEGKILPGMFARVKATVVGTEKVVLTIPEIAIGYDQLGPYVLVVEDKNIVERRSVKLGLKVDERRVVQEGLSGDELVITKGQMRAFPGRPATPVRENQPVPPAAGKPAPPPNQGPSTKANPGKNGK